MREIVFDTETTGLDFLTGDRLIEVGCVELLNHIPTGRTFHTYLNPRRAISAEAVLVHGLTEEFLRGSPCFEDMAESFAEFVGDSSLSPTMPASTAASSTWSSGSAGCRNSPSTASSIR